MDSSARPVLLTTTDGLIENQTSVALSADGKTFYYCTNAKDIERRHIWAVPVTGGTPVQITTGEGVETYPGAARLGQVSGDAERQIGTCRNRWACGRWGRRTGGSAAAEDRLPDVAAGLSDGRCT